jgi:dTDP-glucose 4,6-dehydratase
MKFNSKNLLVTGGAGFIGSNFIHYIFNKYDNINIVNLDSLTYAGDIKNTESFSNNSKYKFIKGDICDKNLVDDILNESKINYSINSAFI